MVLIKKPPTPSDFPSVKKKYYKEEREEILEDGDLFLETSQWLQRFQESKKAPQEESGHKIRIHVLQNSTSEKLARRFM